MKRLLLFLFLLLPMFSFGAALPIYVTRTNNYVVWHGNFQVPYATFAEAKAAAVAGDWVISYGSDPITTNNLLKAGVNFEFYPPIIYVEAGTAAQSGGFGIFDDRDIPTGTTNIIICHSDIKYNGGTNQPLSGNTFVGNANCMGAIVSTNANTQYTFYGKDIYCSSYVTAQRDIVNAINHFAGSENSFYQFNNIRSFAPSTGGTNQFGAPVTRLDGSSGVQVYSNGCKMVCFGEIDPNGTYSVQSTSADPNINANFYLTGTAKLKRKIYFSWTSPNWRAWMNIYEVNTAGIGGTFAIDCASLYGAGKIYINCRKMAADAGIIVNTQQSGGASNIDVWVSSDKFEASGTCTEFVDVQAGKLTLAVNNYTNLDTSVTAGFVTTGGLLIANGGTMNINAQQAFGVRLNAGTNELNNLKIVNNLVSHAGNNAITNAGGVGAVMRLTGCTLVVPALAQSITAGAAATVASYWSAGSQTNNSNVTLSPNAGFTVDLNVK